MSALRRTKIGAFNVDDAMQWENLQNDIEQLMANDSLER